MDGPLSLSLASFLAVKLKSMLLVLDERDRGSHVVFLTTSLSVVLFFS